MDEVIPPVDSIKQKECQGENKAATLINSSCIPTLPPEIFGQKHLKIIVLSPVGLALLNGEFIVIFYSIFFFLLLQPILKL